MLMNVEAEMLLFTEYIMLPGFELHHHVYLLMIKIIVLAPHNVRKQHKNYVLFIALKFL